MFTIVKSIRCRSITPVSASPKARLPGAPTTSPTKRIFIKSGVRCQVVGVRRGSSLSPVPHHLSPRIFPRPRLPNHGHFDLSWVLQLRFDLLRNVAGEPERLVIRYASRLDDDPELPARLDGERLLDSLESIGDVLELLEPLDVGFQDLPAGAGPGGRERVRSVDEHGFQRTRLVVSVMALHAVDHGVALAEFLQDFAAELEMRPVHLAIDRLADVVEEAGALGDLDVAAELRRHVRGEPGDLLGVLEHVLTVGSPVLEPSEKLDQLRVEVRDPEFERRRLPFLADLLPELGADLLDDLLDPCGMDS